MPQSLSKQLTHIIFSTKDRQPFLSNDDLCKEMHAYLATIFKEYDSPALIIGGVSDHVHILSNLSRNFALSKVIAEAKRNSSKWIKTKGYSLRNFYWQGGYGAFSVCQSQITQVKNYIARQPQHHKNVTFQDEFREFLAKYEMEYDERYVWD